MSDGIIALRVPKWGLSMREGRIGDWLVALGQPVNDGQDVLEIETDKITNVLESPGSGLLRRQLVAAGETLAVGRLIGILADADVTDDQIDAYVAEQALAAADDDAAENPEESAPLLTAAFGDCIIQYSRTGPQDGEKVILIHGFAGDLQSWMMAGMELAKTYDVIAVDLPGHGGSTKSVGDGSIAGLARDLAGFMAELGINSAHLVGHSMGAAVAMELARQQPAASKSLTLIAPVGLPGAQVSSEFLQGVVAAARQRDMRQWLEMLVADPRLISKVMVDDVIKAKRRDGASEALRLLADRMGSGIDLNQIAQAPPLDVPVLILMSPDDRIAGQPDLARLPPAYRFESIINTGHMPHIEAPGPVIALILAHIGQ